MAVINVQKLSETVKYHRLDSEFYQPEYHIDFSKGNWEPIKKFLDICQYGISQAMTSEPMGYPIFRMDDIKDCFLENDEVKYVQISDGMFKEYRLQPNDVLFNRVNSEQFVGRTGIFKLSDDYTFASYLIRLRLKNNSDILPDYLNIFLNSMYGLKQIRRFLRRAVNQANVNAEELKNFKIAILNNKIQNTVEQLCNDAWKQLELSKSQYTKAENRLLHYLGLSDFQPTFILTYKSNLSNVFESHRLEAEYFQPMYGMLKEHLTSLGCYSINEVKEFNGRGVQPIYVQNGDIKVVTSKRLGKRFIDYENLETTSFDEWEENPDAKIKQFDTLIYTTGAYVGSANCFMQAKKAIASNHVNIVRARYFNPIYLSLYLNSIVGQMQVNQHVSGSAQFELYPSDISKFLVWKAPKKIQNKIGTMVMEAYQAKLKSMEYIIKARKLVESTIDNL